MGCVPCSTLDLDDARLGKLWVGDALEVGDPWQELADDVERRVTVAGRDDDAVETLERAYAADAVAVLEGDVRDASDARRAEDLEAVGKKEFSGRSRASGTREERTTTRGRAGQRLSAA